MRYHFDRKAVSAAAKRLRAHLDRQDTPIGHQPALDAVARVLGYEDSNTLMAALKAEPATAPAPFDGIDLPRFLSDLDSVIATARGDINSDIQALARVEQVRQALAGNLQTPPDDVLMKAAVRRAAGSMPVDPMIFIDGRDGRPVEATLDRSGTPQRDDPAALASLRDHLRRLASDPAVELPERLIAVAEEAGNVFRLVTTLPVSPRIDDPFVEINTRLAPHGLGLFDDGDGLTVQRHDEMAMFDTDLEAARFLVRRAAMGDPTARLAFGFLRDNAEARFQRLMHDLRVDQNRRTRPSNLARIGQERPGLGQARLFGWVAWISEQYLESGHPTTTMRLKVRRIAGGDGYELVYQHQDRTHIDYAHTTTRDSLAEAAAAAERAGDTWPLGFRPLNVALDEDSLRIAFTRT